MEEIQFLGKLTEMAKKYGWQSGYTEVILFVEWCYKQNGVTLLINDLIPFDDEDEQ